MSIARLASALLRGWNRFWFTPVPASTLVLWRTALGVTSIAWLLAIVVDLETFFGENGLRPNPFYADHRIGLFQWVESDWALWLVWCASLASAVAVTAGRWVKPAAIVLFYGVLSIELDNTSILNAGDVLLRIWLAYFAIFALLTPSRCLEVPLLGTRPTDGGGAVRHAHHGSLHHGNAVAVRQYPMVPSWLLRLVQLQMTVIYPAGLFKKLDGSNWRDGTAALYALGLEDFERFPVPSLLTDSLTVGWILTYATLAVEISVPFLLWTRRTRRFAIAAGIGLHVGFDYALRVGFFAWGMIIGYVAFLRADESLRIIDWLRRLGPRLRRVFAPPTEHEPRQEPGGRDRADVGAPSG
jgi:hypothetical protein